MAKTEEVKGFTVIPVRIPINKNYNYTHNPTTTHYMLCKKHQSNTDKELADRSIFLINAPLGTTLQHIKKLMSAVAPNSLIENFFLNDENLDYEINLTHLTSELYSNDDENRHDECGLRLPNGTGLLVFVDKSSANLAMTKMKKYSRDAIKSQDGTFIWQNDDDIKSVKFLEMYKTNMLDVESMSDKIDLALLDFETREKASIDELKNMKNIVDEDGFTLVVGKNRKTKRGILGKIDSVTKIQTEETNKKMKKKEKADFYRFQIREKKKEEMNELLRKFKNDQEKIRLLKEKKKFRPY